METTNIAGRDVPVARVGDVPIVNFSAGRLGEDEAGAWEFWTATNDGRGITVRCRQGRDPGERFRIMEGTPGYEDAWEFAQTATAIRPATRSKVILWLDRHPEDAVHATSCQVGSKIWKIAQTKNGRWGFVDRPEEGNPQ